MIIIWIGKRIWLRIEMSDLHEIMVWRVSKYGKVRYTHINSVGVKGSFASN